MTTIIVSDKRITIKGHSGYSTVGSDIVCAAISTLSEATYYYLKSTGNEVYIAESDGLFIINIKKINVPGKQIRDTFIQMVDDLVGQYPKYLKREKV